MKELTFLIIVAILAKVALSLDYITEQPDYLQSCSLRDPDFVKCSTKSTQQLYDQMRDGIPGLKTLQKLEVYHIRKLKLSQNIDQSNFVAELGNVVIKGLGQVVVKENAINVKDLSWATKLYVPKLQVEADYKIDGRVLVVTLKGEGKGFLKLDDVTMDVLTKVNLFEKGDLTFVNVTDIKIDFKIGGLKIRLDNLFNGVPELGESVNALLNENWMDFIEPLRPALSQTVEGILLDNLQKVFNYIPAKFFISDIPTSEQLNG